jgi:malic enzyme
MKQWAYKVKQLNIRCPVCQRIHPEPEISPEAALDARISRFIDAMKLAAAAGIAPQANEAALMPAALEPMLPPRVAQAVGDAAQREQALAGSAHAVPTR